MRPSARAQPTRIEVIDLVIDQPMKRVARRVVAIDLGDDAPSFIKQRVGVRAIEELLRGYSALKVQ